MPPRKKKASKKTASKRKSKRKSKKKSKRKSKKKSKRNVGHVKIDKSTTYLFPFLGVNLKATGVKVHLAYYMRQMDDNYWSITVDLMETFGSGRRLLLFHNVLEESDKRALVTLLEQQTNNIEVQKTIYPARLDRIPNVGYRLVRIINDNGSELVIHKLLREYSNSLFNRLRIEQTVYKNETILY